MTILHMGVTGNHFFEVVRLETKSEWSFTNGSGYGLMSGLLPLTGGQQRFFLLAGGREWNVGLGRAQLEVFP